MGHISVRHQMGPPQATPLSGEPARTRGTYMFALLKKFPQTLYHGITEASELGSFMLSLMAGWKHLFRSRDGQRQQPQRKMSENRLDGGT